MAGPLVQPLFHRIAKCIDSPHFQIAERALYLLNSPSISQYAHTHAELVVRILYEPVARNIINGKIPASAINVNQNSPNNNSGRNSGGQIGSGCRVSELNGTIPTIAPAVVNLQAFEKTNDLPGHWSPTVIQLTHDLMSFLKQIDERMVVSLQQQLENNLEQRKANLSKRELLWKSIESKHGNVTLADLAAKSGRVNDGEEKIPHRGTRLSLPHEPEELASPSLASAPVPAPSPQRGSIALPTVPPPMNLATPTSAE